MSHNTSKKKDTGAGYGGSAGDKQQRNKGKKQALQREKKTWKNWEHELIAFIKKKQEQQQHPKKNNNKRRNPVTATVIEATTATTSRNGNSSMNGDDNSTTTTTSSSILNTLKQVLRCQAPNWWYQAPQRRMYTLAIKASILLTEYDPRAWGDPEDTESALAALEELAETAKLLVSTSSSSSSSSCGAASSPTTTTTTVVTTTVVDGDDPGRNAYQQLREQSLQAIGKRNSTTETDLLLPHALLQVREAAVAATQVLFQPQECRMMDAQDFYRQQMRPLAFAMVDANADDTGAGSSSNNSFDNPRHYYALGNQAGYERSMAYKYQTTTKASTNNKQKMKGKHNTTQKSSTRTGGIKSSATVLWKELSTYPTALPIEYGSSIFVRARENELDQLRVLIIGPDDTPYANGCFFFDVTLGDDYPHKPPKVHFLTTSSFLSSSSMTTTTTTTTTATNTNTNTKKVRFNPNLYEDGKVCLSLLGTWQGPGWMPQESTLLQVLISLQSLVLGATDPYYNEPGYEHTEGTPTGTVRSQAYNTKIRQQTVRVAMLPFLYNQVTAPTTTATATATAVGGGECTIVEGSSLSTTIGNNKKRRPSPRPLPTTTTTTTTQSRVQYYSEFQEVLELHFQLKQSAIRKQLFQWLQDDPTGLNVLYSDFWTVSEQLERQDKEQKQQQQQQQQQQSSAKRPRRQTKIKIKMKEGVILLDDDDDDDDDTNNSDLQQALVNSMAIGIDIAMDTAKSTSESSTAQQNGSRKDDIIELMDSDSDSADDDGMDRKPAAVVGVVKNTIDSNTSTKKEDDKEEGDDRVVVGGDGNILMPPQTNVVVVAGKTGKEVIELVDSDEDDDDDDDDNNENDNDDTKGSRNSKKNQNGDTRNRLLVTKNNPSKGVTPNKSVIVDLTE